MATAQLQLHFLHPRTSDAYPALVAPQCTAQLALQRLQAPETGPFLDAPAPGRPYELVVSRTNQALTPNTSMADAGVVDQDQLEVRQAGQGA